MSETHAVHTLDAEVAAAIAAVPADATVRERLAIAALLVGPLGKDSYNDEQKFRFRSIEAMMARIGPIMASLGLVVLPKVTGRTLETYERGQHKNIWRLVTLEVDFVIEGPAGDERVIHALGEGFDNGDRAASKAMTGAWKFAVQRLLGIADDVDPDANRGSAEQQARRQGPQGGQRQQGRQQGERRPAQPPSDEAKRQEEAAAERKRKAREAAGLPVEGEAPKPAPRKADPPAAPSGAPRDPAGRDDHHGDPAADPPPSEPSDEKITTAAVNDLLGKMGKAGNAPALKRAMQAHFGVPTLTALRKDQTSDAYRWLAQHTEQEPPPADPLFDAEGEEPF